ncbi:helix-turn-helix domain-containing protein [Streptacidiphilus sp. ASG 303]|uniref:helix-turn-helix domain-containing protein n=1 Tax=Streptacidiphilus sp. ASG 303 TaxID=2896847 RepID=UPI001E56E2AD|nr:helix-turn-helix domain-containing protein [Streptacidiphilus sp. ASG 303]MCD0485005.1 helix-turn-helix domain-containing protein [Streptacidiphilus sp. ASG 303]
MSSALFTPAGANRRPLATPEELSGYLGVPVATLYAWSYRRRGSVAIKVGRHLRYRWKDIDAWVEHQASTHR